MQANRLERPRWVAGVVLPLLLQVILICPAHAGPPCASTGGFYSNAQTFETHLAQLGILPTASWNFSRHDLPLASSVVLNDPLNFNTHAANVNDPWTNNGGQNLWPTALNNIQFSSNMTPNGALTPRGVGGLTFATPAGSNVLGATVAADSLNIVCESPASRTCQAMVLGLVGPGIVRVRVYIEFGQFSETAVNLAPGQQSILRFIKSRIVRIDIWNSSGSENVTSLTLFRRPATIDIAGNDGVVNVADLLAVINAWGACPAPPTACLADVAPPGGNNQVNVDDLLAIINAWGPIAVVGRCVGGNPSIGHCSTTDDCFTGICVHTGCTPSVCICDDTGQWICTDDCCGHCS